MADINLNKKCVYLLVILSIYCVSSDGVLLERREFTYEDCSPMVPFKENDCNKCFCTPDGELACANSKHCALNIMSYNCAVGTSWIGKCGNRCWCLDSVGTVCTDRECRDSNDGLNDDRYIFNDRDDGIFDGSHGNHNNQDSHGSQGNHGNHGNHGNQGNHGYDDLPLDAIRIGQ